MSIAKACLIASLFEVRQLFRNPTQIPRPTPLRPWHLLPPPDVIQEQRVSNVKIRLLRCFRINCDKKGSDIRMPPRKEGLGLARLMMVLSSMAPLFALWAIRGVNVVPNIFFISICMALIAIPNLVLAARLWIAKIHDDSKKITVRSSEDHRDHILVYLFAMLLPLYDANIGTNRDFAATVAAFIFIAFLFWHLNLHYMNILFALFGYRVFSITSEKKDGVSGTESLVLLTRRRSLIAGEEIRTLRISNTVLWEIGEQ